MFENEECWVILGTWVDRFWFGRLVPLGSGTPSTVSFDLNTVMELEEKHNSVIGFMHTHPAFLAYPSSTDHRTMNCWSVSLGKPLVCVIRGTDATRAFIYYDYEQPIRSMIKYSGDVIAGLRKKIEFSNPNAYRMWPQV